MKKSVLLGLGLLAATLSHAQSTEFSAHLTSGLAAFRGSSAQSMSVIYASPYGRAYTANPYGKRPGLAYGLAGQVQRVTAHNTVLGVQAGYEVLQSRVEISNVFDRSDAGTPATGHTTLANGFINAHPYAGHRFSLRALNLDLTAGPEVGFLRRSHEKGEATVDRGTTYTTDLDRHQSIKTDVRARLNLTAYYKHAGLSLGYSAGLANYRRGYVGGTNELYSQAFRIGLVYRFHSV
jgi:hypothetical protein